MADLVLLIGSLLANTAKHSQTYHNTSNGECGVSLTGSEHCALQTFHLSISFCPETELEFFIFISQNQFSPKDLLPTESFCLMAAEFHHGLIAGLWHFAMKEEKHWPKMQRQDFQISTYTKRDSSASVHHWSASSMMMLLIWDGADLFKLQGLIKVRINQCLER